MAEDIFYCPNCGGVMEFDVKSQKLKCPNCDHTVDIANNKKSIVEHSLTARAMQTIKAEEKKSTTVQCKGCGAQMEVDAYSTAMSCPYCGSSYVMADKQEEVIVPDGVIPFKIDKNSAKEIVGKWLKRRYLAPGELKTLYQRGDFNGIYVPYWTFDADADADYTGMGGRKRVEHYRDKDGKMQSRTVTDWYPTRGHVHNFFDDVLVSASSHHDRSLLDGVDDYDTKQTASYAPDYMSGYGAESFNINLDSAHGTAIGRMKSSLQDMARQDILRRYDSAKDVHINARFKNETYKHILLPVYAVTYHYKNKVYNVLVNGQTGSIKGQYPKSVVKILLIIIAVAAILIGILFAAGSSDDDYDTYGSYGSVAEYVCEDSYGYIECSDYQEYTVTDEGQYFEYLYNSEV